MRSITLHACRGQPGEGWEMSVRRGADRWIHQHQESQQLLIPGAEPVLGHPP